MLLTPPFPPRLTLELTNACNYRCAMCPSRLRPDQAKGLMAPSLFRRIVDQAALHLPVTLVPFFRGEPLLHPELLPLLAHAKGRGLGPIQLVTNGMLLTAEIAQGLLDLGLDFISFSLDTVSPVEYAQIRQGGDFVTVMANLARFLDLRGRGGYATEVQVSATRTSLNQESIGHFIAYWQQRADRTRIYYEHSGDGHTGSLDCPEVPRFMERRPCHKLFGDMVVYFDGGVALCNHDWYRAPALGDLNTSTVAEVWLGPAYQELRRQHQASLELSDPTCRHCDHWKISYLDKPYVGELYTPAPEARRAGQA
ncbi:MAG: radical SAM protein [Desulfarculus sp.]|nr:radical SAM protein [Desulfarculus sp.]